MKTILDIIIAVIVISFLLTFFFHFMFWVFAGGIIFFLIFAGFASA